MKVLIDAKIASIPYPCTFIFWLFGHNFPLLSPLYDYTFVDIKFSNSHQKSKSLYYSPASRCINDSVRHYRGRSFIRVILTVNIKRYQFTSRINKMDLSSLLQIDNSWRLENADLLQEIATLLWVEKGEDDLLKKITSARIMYEMYQRLSGGNEVDKLRDETTAKIAKWVKDHPKATKEEMIKEISKQITLFAKKVDQM